MRDECLAAGTRLLAVYIPDRDWNSIPALAPCFEELGVPLLDLAQLQQPPSQTLFYERDGHFTAAGHAFAAHAIAECLDQEGW